MLHSAKSALMFTTMQPNNTLNRPSSAWQSFNIRQKLGLFVLGVIHMLNYWIFPQFASNWHKWVDGFSTLTVWPYQLTHEIFIFVKILFNFKQKILEKKAKNQKFELITSHHFKNLISPKPAWNSQRSLIHSRNLMW